MNSFATVHILVIGMGCVVNVCTIIGKEMSCRLAILRLRKKKGIIEVLNFLFNDVPGCKTHFLGMIIGGGIFRPFF